MRRRRIIMFFAMIMSVAIIGVGFAAWIITAPTAPKEQSGTITVDTVEVRGWTFQTYWVSAEDETTSLGDDYKPSIVFGTPKDLIKNAWLTNDNKTNIGEEQLVAYLYVKGVHVEGVVGGYTIPDSADIAISVLNGDNEITPKNFEINISEEDKNIDATQLENGVVITITFKWKTPKVDGTGTVDTNPYTYYNGEAYSTEVATKAKTYLESLYSELNGVKFKVTLTANQAK